MRRWTLPYNNTIFLAPYRLIFEETNYLIQEPSAFQRHEKRAFRRQKELELSGLDVSVEETLRQLHDRDKRDASRDVAPLKAADDAIRIDTTNLNIEETVDLLKQTVRDKIES